MGHPVWERLGGKLYSIGFTAYQGKAGTAFAKEAWDIGPAPEGSLEDLCHRTGEDLLFLDFSGIRSQADLWLNRPLSSRPLGHSPMQAVWPRHLDAMIFTDGMTPSTKPPAEPDKK